MKRLSPACSKDHKQKDYLFSAPAQSITRYQILPQLCASYYIVLFLVFVSLCIRMYTRVFLFALKTNKERYFFIAYFIRRRKEKSLIKKSRGRHQGELLFEWEKLIYIQTSYSSFCCLSSLNWICGLWI